MSLSITCAQTIGERDYQEDRYCILSPVSSRTPYIHMLGIFDGHGGDTCSEFLRERLAAVSSFYFDHVYTDKRCLSTVLDCIVDTIVKEWNDFSLGKGVFELFEPYWQYELQPIKTANVLEECRDFLFDSLPNRAERLHTGKSAGSTLSVVIIDTNNHKVYSTNIGDSIAILVTPDEIWKSIEHVVDEPCPTLFPRNIKNGRVTGMLNMSRAVGDHCQELFGRVSCEPELASEHAYIDGRSMLVISSDGIIEHYPEKTDVSAHSYASEYLKGKRYCDNTTVLHVQL